jgi:hypothetical protein
MESYNHEIELNINHRDRMNLAPRERWVYRIGRLKYPSDTQRLVWVCGSLGRRNTSWVSSFSVDVIRSLTKITSTKVAHVFCKHGGGRKLRSIDILTRLVIQVLGIWPELAVHYPDLFSLRRFKQLDIDGIGSVTDRLPRDGTDDGYRVGCALGVWTLLRDMLQRLKTSKVRQGQKLLIIIDRVDLCKSNVDFSIVSDLLPLQMLSDQLPFVNVIVSAANIRARQVESSLRGSWNLN